MLVLFKFPKFLGNLAEPSDLQFEPRALSDFPRRQLASTRSRRIPFGKVRDVDHGLEYLLHGFIYDLGAFDYSHAVPWRCANGPRSFGEHGGEGPRIEDGA